MKLPDYEAWAVFACVAETGSFTAAARELGASKAAVSKAVARLEEQLGTVLFHRTSRRLSLSVAGSALLESARRIVAEGEAAMEAARDEAQVLTGTVRIAAPMSFGLRALAPLVAQLMAEHPGIVLDLHLADQKVDLVDQGFDLAVRIGLLPDSSLRAIRLRDVERRLVAAPSYLERQGAPARPEDLSAHRALVYANTATPGIWQLTGPDGERVAVRPRVALSANNSDIMLPALLAGEGIAELPDFLCDEALAGGGLQSLLPEWRFDPLGLYLVLPPSPRRPARVDAVIAFLRWHLGAG